MSTRREFITLLGGAAAAWPIAARGQQVPRMLQIAIWMGRANNAEGLRLAAAFREAIGPSVGLTVATSGWTIAGLVVISIV